MMKTNFSVTCSLLSQFIKQKGSLMDMAAPATLGSDSKGGHHRPPPTTLCLLPGVDVSDDGGGETIVTAADIAAAAAMDSGDPPPAPLTIFYDGKVMVFDNFPAQKAMDLMKLASDNFSAAPAADSPAAAAGEMNGHQKRQVSSMPQARRASLHRFLEKRKDRILAMAPYNKVKDSPSSPPATAPPPPHSKAEELPGGWRWPPGARRRRRRRDDRRAKPAIVEY